MLNYIPSEFISSLGPALTARRMRLLSDHFLDVIQLFLENEGLNAPARSVSTLLCLLQFPGILVSELAAKVALSHPLMTNLLGQMEMLALIRVEADQGDRRKRHVFLTKEGERQAIHVQQAQPFISSAYASISDDIGLDLWSVISKIDVALARQSFKQRLAVASENATHCEEI